jgi:FKBP-type peptidyl-prolyl cis-trans isomerase FkpA
MKNLNLFIIFSLVASITLTSCDKNKTALPELKTQIDSLNYALGVAYGGNIYEGSIASKGDSIEIAIKAFMKGFNEGIEGDIDPENAEVIDLGTQIGTALKEQKKSGLLGDSSLKVDIDLIKQGLINGLKGSNVQMTPEEAQVYLNATMETLKAKRDEAKYGPNKTAGELFLAENSKKAGVITTTSGLQYEVITKGKGALPTDDSKVKVHYHGTLIDGTVFDSSVDRKEPATFLVGQVIPGWTEALKLMPVGSKYKLYIPQQLAYGSRDMGPQSPIKPFSTLIFEVELISIEK